MKNRLLILLSLMAISAMAMQSQLPSSVQRQEEFLKILIDGSFADTKSLLEKGGANAAQPFDFGRIPGKNADFQGVTPLRVLLSSSESIPDKSQKIELLLSKGANKADLNSSALAAVRNTKREEFRWLIQHGAQVSPEITDAIQKLENSTERYKNIAAQIRKIIAEEKELPIQLPQVAVDVQREQDLVLAIKTGNLDAVKAAIAAGASPKEPIKFVFGFKGKKPFEIAYEMGNYPIAQLLLQSGARDPQMLYQHLLVAVQNYDLDQVKRLIAFGAKDEKNVVSRWVTAEIDYSENDPIKTSKLIQIQKVLEQAKGPIRLTPMAKPVAAAIPDAKPAAQPVRLVPRAKPIAKPAAAKPMTMAETLEEIAKNPKTFSTGTPAQK